MDVDQILATLIADLTSPTSPVISTAAKCCLELTTFDGQTNLSVHLIEWEFSRTRQGHSQVRNSLSLCRFPDRLDGGFVHHRALLVPVHAAEHLRQGHQHGRSRGHARDRHDLSGTLPVRIDVFNAVC